MTKPKVLITGDPSPFVMNSLLQQYIDGEIDIVLDHPEVDIYDYDMIAEGGKVLPILNEEQLALIDKINEYNLRICPNWICDSITLIEDVPKQKSSPSKTKTIAKHNYPWYHQRCFR
ncbi:hypothetical protein [Vibrio phage vB_VibM_10AMN]|uniref:Uncharacterized protein n=1 Tax=Staphylococcus phage vB_VibM_10AMN12 TaxID=3076785 RepID=A0AA96KT01_9CAUD|nr:hypothetical protein [Vibrio phage vB_VibM_10AMN]WNO47448.1 hypothetical protein [Staphylococcus phage vB_VibM_10AMN12]